MHQIPGHEKKVLHGVREAKQWLTNLPISVSATELLVSSLFPSHASTYKASGQADSEAEEEPLGVLTAHGLRPMETLSDLLCFLAGTT